MLVLHELDRCKLTVDHKKPFSANERVPPCIQRHLAVVRAVSLRPHVLQDQNTDTSLGQCPHIRVTGVDWAGFTARVKVPGDRLDWGRGVHTAGECPSRYVVN